MIFCKSLGMPPFTNIAAFFNIVQNAFHPLHFEHLVTFLSIGGVGGWGGQSPLYILYYILNIARIANAALHKLPGKSSLKVRSV